MAHPALLSYGLYRLPTFSQELANVGAVPGPTGYDAIRAQYGSQLNGTQVVPPSKRTVEKMLLNGLFVKYVTCNNIIQLLNVARTSKHMPSLPASTIEEHEYVVIRLQENLEAIGKEHGGLTKVELSIAERLDVPRGLIRAMRKNYRTTHARCVRVVEAVHAIYGRELRISNEYPSARPEPITQGLLDL